METYIRCLELAHEEHAMLAFDGLIAYVDEGEAGLIVFNPRAMYYHLPRANFLAMTAH